MLNFCCIPFQIVIFTPPFPLIEIGNLLLQCNNNSSPLSGKLTCSVFVYLVVVKICFRMDAECLKLQILLYSFNEGSKHK